MMRSAGMGRFSVDLIVANNRDVVNLADDESVLDKVKHVVVSGVVDSGAARLVLPQRVVDESPVEGRFGNDRPLADNRLAKRQIVSNVWLQLLGRHSVFTAVVEPAREDALIGAIVLEELDLLVDCLTQSLHLRDPELDPDRDRVRLPTITETRSAAKSGSYPIAIKTSGLIMPRLRLGWKPLFYRVAGCAQAASEALLSEKKRAVPL